MDMSKLEAALSLHQQGNLEGAEQAYLEILVDEPENSEALKLLGVLACQQENTGDGISYLEAALEIQPENAEYHLAIGRAYFQAGRHEDGINALLKAGELDPGQSEIFATLGYFFQHVKDFSSSQKAYERAAVIDPENTQFKAGAGLSAVFAGDEEKASELLGQVTQENDSIHQAHYGLALLAANKDDLAQASSHIGKALTLKPDDPEYARFQAQIASKMG